MFRGHCRFSPGYSPVLQRLEPGQDGAIRLPEIPLSSDTAGSRTAFPAFLPASFPGLLPTSCMSNHALFPCHLPYTFHVPFFLRPSRPKLNLN